MIRAHFRRRLNGSMKAPRCWLTKLKAPRFSFVDGITWLDQRPALIPLRPVEHRRRDRPLAIIVDVAWLDPENSREVSGRQPHFQAMTAGTSHRQRKVDSESSA